MKFLYLFLLLLLPILCYPLDYSAHRYLAERMPATEDTIEVDSKLKVAPGTTPEEKKAEEASAAFTSSWRFYFIMLIFPVILILIFVLVFIRGKRG